MDTLSPIILASASPTRRMLLERAGVKFETRTSSIDERAAERPLDQAGAPPEDIASLLAEAKALDVAASTPGTIVIGADQVLAVGETRLTKPEDMDAARRQLLDLSGRAHSLYSSLVLVREEQTIWRYTDVAHLTMRTLTPAFVGRYLAVAGEAALSSVGAYQVEGPGIQLFQEIDGDMFTILGLPMLPLLEALRGFGAIAA